VHEPSRCYTRDTETVRLRIRYACIYVLRERARARERESEMHTCIHTRITYIHTYIHTYIITYIHINSAALVQIHTHNLYVDMQYIGYNIRYMAREHPQTERESEV
jgi:hypothetical protein